MQWQYFFVLLVFFLSMGYIRFQGSLQIKDLHGSYSYIYETRFASGNKVAMYWYIKWLSAVDLYMNELENFIFLFFFIIWNGSIIIA